MSHRRTYKSGTAYCLWRWTDVASEYITRLHLVKTPWFAICLHWINKPDPEPFHHDHPVSFLSLILRGGYREAVLVSYEQDYWTREKVVYRQHRWFNIIRTTHKHTIVEVQPNTLTLAIMGPKRQEWGFYQREGKVYWKDYYKALRQPAT